MAKKWHKFKVLAQPNEEDPQSVAIISGSWWGKKSPMPVEVRDRIISALVPWLATENGKARATKYGTFDIGDLWNNLTPGADDSLREAGIMDLHVMALEGTSDWVFTDDLAPEIPE